MDFKAEIRVINSGMYGINNVKRETGTKKDEDSAEMFLDMSPSV